MGSLHCQLLMRGKCFACSLDIGRRCPAGPSQNVEATVPGLPSTLLVRSCSSGFCAVCQPCVQSGGHRLRQFFSEVYPHVSPKHTQPDDPGTDEDDAKEDEYSTTGCAGSNKEDKAE